MRRLPKATLDLLESANVAVKHAAMLLGRVTHAANNCPISEIGPSGDSITRIGRDAMPAPRVNKRKAETQLVAPVPPKKPAVPSAKAWTARDEPSRGPGKSASSLQAARARQLDAACVRRRVDEIGASLSASSSSASAADRLDELMRRVRSRFGP